MKYQKIANLKSVSAKNEIFFSPNLSLPTHLYPCWTHPHCVLAPRWKKAPTVPDDGVVADVQLPERDEEADPVGELAQVL
jgi:hypothetical protein